MVLANYVIDVLMHHMDINYKNMNKLKEHFKSEYQLLLTDSQLREIAKIAIDDCVDFYFNHNSSKVAENEFKVLESKKYRLNRDFEVHGLKKGDILTCCHHNPNRANKYHLEGSAVGIYIHGENLEEVKDELTVEDLKAGEWYHMATEVGDFLLKFERIINSNSIKTYKHLNYNPAKHFFATEPFKVVVNKDMGYHEKDGDKLRHATREEIIKYFPHEFEIDTHGGNDIPQLTDPQL
jgi:hypothetical protein